MFYYGSSNRYFFDRSACQPSGFFFQIFKTTTFKLLKMALTVGFIASLPSGYYRVRDENGCAIVRNLNIDILLNRGKILKKPDLKTIWVSFEKISLNEYINEKPLQLYFYETKNPYNY